MSACVVDASAILAYAFKEKGAVKVGRWIDRGAAVSALTIQETVSKLRQAGLPKGDAEELCAALGLDVRALDLSLALAAGNMFPLTKRFGLSHGDRACLALGLALGVPVITADKRWSDVADDLAVKVEQFR